MMKDVSFGHRFTHLTGVIMNQLDQAIQANRKANITRFNARPQRPTPYQILYFELLCNEDAKAIERCFKAVPGDPLNNVKTWR